MTVVLDDQRLDDQLTGDQPPNDQTTSSGRQSRRRWSWWKRFRPLQLLIMGLATIPPLIVLGSIVANVVGIIDSEAMIQLALAAGENPGTVVFGAMFLATPVQWLTGRTQIRVRKYLGIVFYLLALSNGAMFIIESGVGRMLDSPLLIAGTIGLVLATPLFITSSRWSQRVIGMKRWRLLHKLTYVVAAALVAHVILVGDIGPGFVLIVIGFVARIPAVRRRLMARHLAAS